MLMHVPFKINKLLTAGYMYVYLVTELAGLINRLSTGVEGTIRI